MENFNCDGLCFCPDGTCKKWDDLKAEKNENNDINCCSGSIKLPTFLSDNCTGEHGYSEFEKPFAAFQIAKQKFLSGKIFTLPEDNQEQIKSYYHKQGYHIMQAHNMKMENAEHHCKVNARNSGTPSECYIFSTKLMGVYKSVAMDITQFNFVD